METVIESYLNYLYDPKYQITQEIPEDAKIRVYKNSKWRSTKPKDTNPYGTNLDDMLNG